MHALRVARNLFIFVWIAGFCLRKTKGDDDETVLRTLESRGFQFLEYSTLHHDSRVIRNRFKREATPSNLLQPIKIGFKYDDEHYELELNTPQQILHPSAEVLTFTNRSVQQWSGAHPDCFLTGTVTSHSGVASLAFCDKIVGLVKTRKHALYLESISEIVEKDNLQIIIGQQPLGEISNHGTKRLDVYKGARSRRSVTSHNITIEMAVYMDAAYTQTMLVTDFSKRLQHILLKYYAVQMEWSRADMLDFYVQIVLKKVHFFEENPEWYNTSTNLLGSMLYQFCMGTAGDGPFDIRYMHVGLSGLDVMGRAYQNSVCDQTYNCAVDSATGAASFAATAHEIGHLLGMRHDAERGCSGNNVGLMGGYGTGWSSCSKEDMAALLSSGNKDCLWEENIPQEEVPKSIANETLISAIPGQIYSPDQVCELKYGTGYQFRKYPKLGVCVLYSCANHNGVQINYGQMFQEQTSIFGMYCEKDKICFKMGCVDASTAKLTKLVGREGGWSQWEPWTGCTRTCGRGINYRKRKCDNPAPINFEGCAGEAYEAEICNAQPCPNDSSNEATLRDQRASETCKSLRDNKVINPDLYNETGSRYSDTAHGQCEVTCDPIPGHTIPTFTRFGFMPDGVACTGGSDPWDLDNWPRNSGYYYLCLDGLCQRFGCDDKLNGQVLDECGVCGGNDSTCIVISKTDTKLQNPGERRTLAVLPAGTFNIQFWFPYKEMAQNFLELYSKNGNVILASRIPSSWVWDARLKPVVFAGTEWYYYFYDQYLYAKEPLTESCEIKLFQFDVNNNTGVSFTYSEPLAVKNECGFESGYCDWSIDHFTRIKYGSNESSVPIHDEKFGDYFIHMSSLTSDKTATIAKQNIHGTSYVQYLSLNYHATGIGSKITVSLHGGNNTSVLWRSKDSSQLMINEWKFATVNITTFEKYEIRITCETKVQYLGTISLDDLKLSYYEDSYCNNEDSCVTPSLDLSTSTILVSTTKPTFTTSSTTTKEETTNPVASTTTNLPETTTKINDLTNTTTFVSGTTPVSPTMATESTLSLSTTTSTKATSNQESTILSNVTSAITTSGSGAASSETTTTIPVIATTVAPIRTTETVGTPTTTTITTPLVTKTTQKTPTKLTTSNQHVSTSTEVSAFSVPSTLEITIAKTTPEITIAESTLEITTAKSTPEITTAKSTLEITTAKTTPEITIAESTLEITNAKSTLEITTAESTPEITNAKSTPKITTAESTLEITTTKSTPEITAAKSTPEITNANSTPEITTAESTLEIKTAESTLDSTLTGIKFTYTSSSKKSTTPVSSSSTTTSNDADPSGRYMYMGLAIGIPFIVMLIAVGIFVCCRKCSKCTTKGKCQEKYRVSKQCDGNSRQIDASSKPLSPQFWPDVNEIKIHITNDDDFGLGSKSEI